MSNLWVYILVYIGAGMLYLAMMVIYVEVTRYRRYGGQKVLEALERMNELAQGSLGDGADLFLLYIRNLAFWPVCFSTNVAVTINLIDDYCER